MNGDAGAGGKRDGTNLNLEALVTAARNAENGEAYQEISRDAAHRLGLVASVYPSDCVYYTLECTFRLFPADAGVEPSRLARAASVARLLQEKGYDLAHLDGGWISCEKIVLPEEVLAEAQFLRQEFSDAGASGDRCAPERCLEPDMFFTKAFFDEVSSRLNADPEWHALAQKFSARVVLACADRHTAFVFNVVDGHVAVRDAAPETAADFRFEADEAAWREVMRGHADYYPLVRAHRMKFQGSVLRLRLKMAPLDRMTLTAQRVFDERFAGGGR